MEQALFRRVRGPGRGPAERGLGLVEAAEAGEQVGADSMQEVVSVEGARGRELVGEDESGAGSGGHPHGHDAVQLDDRRREPRRQDRVQPGQARPVGVVRRPGDRVLGRDRGLQGEPPGRAAGRAFSS